jgi:hypothetical protein
MNERSINVIKALANGMDPISGEMLPVGSPCVHPEVIRALDTALNALEHISQQKVSHYSEGGGVKIRTADICDYISQRKEEARQQGAHYIDLVSGDIHNHLSLNSRMPMVCNAMYKMMRTGDEVLRTTPSGQSSTIEIRYYL